jgi:hypothetical protein
MLARVVFAAVPALPLPARGTIATPAASEMRAMRRKDRLTADERTLMTTRSSFRLTGAYVAGADGATRHTWIRADPPVMQIG